jgi:transposase
MNMAKRQFQITTEQETELKVAYDNSKEAALSKKLLGVRLYGTGQPVAVILDLVGCSRATLLDWCHHYCLAGFDGLADKRLGGNHHRLSTVQKKELRARLHRYTPRQVLGDHTATAAGDHWTTADLKQAIYQWYDVRYQSPTSYWLILGECGLSYQRTESLFKNRSAANVAAFEEQLEKN